MSSSAINAVYLYYGILEGYEVVGQELLGDDVVQNHVVPRMKYYVDNFLPFLFQEETDKEIESSLVSFLDELKEKVSNNQTEDITLNDIWELRAAIFGYESAFIELLGENVIKNYVLGRVSDILTIYLPDIFTSDQMTLSEKLQSFASYLKSKEYVKYANFSISGNKKVRFNVNQCEFSRIHDSEAYKQGKVRFCPWGMIVQAIVNSHELDQFPLKGSIFTTRGTITKLEVLNDT